MRQVLFTIPIFGGVRVFGFGASIVVAFITATWLASWRAKREKLDPEVILDMAFWVVFSGMVGARLFYCYEYWGQEIKSVWDILQYWKGGIVFYGGIVGGVDRISSSIASTGRFPCGPYMDVMAPSIAVGIFFGRLGCFLNGCCYGDACQLPWAVSFPKNSPPWQHHEFLQLIPRDALWSLPVHPTQIYSAIDGLVLLLLLSAYYPLRRRDGEVMGLLMLTYPDHAVPGRVSAERRRSVLRRHDDLAEHQRRCSLLGACSYWTWLFSAAERAVSRSAAR